MKIPLPVLLACLPLAAALESPAADLQYPILFVTQVPTTTVSSTITSVGGNHLATVKAAPRGGDLYLLPVNGPLRNLTKDAGLGRFAGSPQPVVQGPGAIAVRDPHVHWGGEKAVFSMLVHQDDESAVRWQLYEVSGMGEGQMVSINKIAGQPENFNNVQPCYDAADRIVFVSDRTRDGSLNTYPAIDEKGKGQINTGLWSLNPETGDLFQIEHSPSGSFDPMVDSYGRIVFSRWDHLQRDETVLNTNAPGGFDYTSESGNASFQQGHWSDVFPEPLFPAPVNPSVSTTGHKFDLFMPWTANQDGTDLLTLNHIGRHEISPAFTRARTDGNLIDFNPPGTLPVLPPFPGGSSNRAGSVLQISESPQTWSRGTYVAVDSVLNGYSAGRVIVLTGRPDMNPAQMTIQPLSETGFVRDPVLLQDGRLMASVAMGPPIGNVTYQSGSGSPNGGPNGNPPGGIDPDQLLATGNSFTIKVSGLPVFGMNSNRVILLGEKSIAGTTPIIKSVVNTIDSQPVPYDGPLWQLQPVELRPTPRPPVTGSRLDIPETAMFTRAKVSPAALREWLRGRGLALLTCRNVTSRDSADLQQPVNLQVPGGVKTTRTGDNTTPYQVGNVQFFQGEYLRGYGLTTPGDTQPDPGRRITARPVPPLEGVDQTSAGAPAGSVKVAADGSMAAVIPARRALSWQLTQPDGAPVVQERYWLSFQAGEIRSCTSCHGVNKTDQAGHSVSINPPAALESLLATLKETNPELGEESPFRIWTQEQFGVISLDPEGDDDADGMSNLVEWVTGASPFTKPSGQQKVIPLTASLLTVNGQQVSSLSFSRSLTAPGTLLRVEASADMQTWRSLAEFRKELSEPTPYSITPGYTMTASPAPDGGSETIRLDSSAPAAQNSDRYFRLSIESR